MGVRGRHGVAELAVIGPGGIETVRRPEPPDECGRSGRHDMSASPQRSLMLAELLQSKFAGLTGFLPRCELNPQLFHGEAGHRSQFPTVPVRPRETMRDDTVQLRSVRCV